MNHIFSKLQSEMKELLPNQEIRLDTNNNGEYCILGYHDAVVLDNVELPIKTIRQEKIVKGWSVTIVKHKHGNWDEPDYYEEKIVGNYLSEDQARLAFIKTIFECSLSDYSEKLGDEEFARQQAEWEKNEI